MAEAIHAAAKIEAEVCRQTARKRFSLEHTIERYFALYRKLAGRGLVPGHLAQPATEHPSEAYA
jgi:hypothetical protein